MEINSKKNTGVAFSFCPMRQFQMKYVSEWNGKEKMMRSRKQTNKLYVHRFAEEPQRRSRGGRIAAEPTVSLVIIDAEQGERESLYLILESPYAGDQTGAIQSGEDGTKAEHVESLVAAESEDERTDGGERRRGDVTETEMLPE